MAYKVPEYTLPAMAPLAASTQPLSLPAVSTAPTYENIIKMLQGTSQLPGQASILPQIQGILGQSSQYLQPAIQGIEQATQANVAQAQTDMMKRGMTGSDIEMQGMMQARTAGQQQIGQLLGNWGLQNAQTMADYTYKALSGDIEAERSLAVMLAQAMGQELTSQRDLAMFQQQLAAALKMAKRNAKTGLFGSIGGIIGGGIGALAGSGAGPMGTLAGWQIGQGGGQAIGAGLSY